MKTTRKRRASCRARDRRPVPPAIACLTCCLAVLATGCWTGCWPTSECGPRGGFVANVIDGDTLDLADGTRVRIVGIDAPESGACWGPQATAAAASLLEDQTVVLEYPPECVDDYGRTLARVVMNGIDAATWLAESGAACAWIIQDLPWGTPIRAAARAAATAGRGFWGACATVPCRSN